MADPVLEEGTFSLDGYKFGGANDPVVVVPGGFDPGVTNWRTQDADNPLGDAMRFGRDRLSPATWGFTLQTNLDTSTQALDAIEEIETVWKGDATRATPGAVQTLRYNLGGRTRRVYGRSRRFAPTISPLTFQGVSGALADFQKADTLHYDDTEYVVDISILAGRASGIKSPLIGPLTTVAGGDRIDTIQEVGGNAPAPFIAIIYGPISNPYIEGPGFFVKLNTTLAYDQYAVIDTRPWAQTVIRNDGVSLGGKLSRLSRLTTARLNPGSASIKFGGTDLTGRAKCRFSWRPTYNSL